MSVETEPVLSEALETIERLRAHGGHLHSITNTVAQNFTANVLLACGASVSMTANPDEIAAFISKADALHVNLGTLDPERETAIRVAADKASELALPTLLDPVMVHVSPLRLRFARALLESATIVKANQSEAKALDLHQDSTCLVTTGAVDTIDHGRHRINVSNGAPLMATTIATGCALGALIAILASKAKEPAIASLAGVLWFSIAGEVAAETAKGPGSFPPAFLDALASIPVEVIEERAKVS